eukprot:TRINITY_DN5114_c0_g1_i3.p1 TRINITY_DN5114_c0_g1~~TRINITY_DN5114_c0_g1_i3.p1  ORF type:complete len:217 (-),score=38.53 TRINITY_DN5114_c0_g1_i3:137-787(-)
MTCALLRAGVFGRCVKCMCSKGLSYYFLFFFFSSRRRHTRCREVSWARRCVQETGINAEYMGIVMESNSIGKQYYIHDCAYHVFSEAERVFQFRDICSKPPYPTQLKELGELMNDSHFSCRDLYGCSSDELDELTSMCREAGALGSRLTGAGWGGCAVSLVESSKVPDFLKAISKFYTPDRMVGKGDLSQYLFATKPGSGAAIYIPQPYTLSLIHI